MTTVIADLRTGKMGGDMFWSDGSRSPKIHQTAQGLIGCSGNESPIMRFVEWITNGGDVPGPFTEDDGGFEAIQIENGKLYMWGRSLRRMELIGRRFHAIGSGGPYAIGAMCRGASIRQALEIAAEYDSFTKAPFSITKAR
jgi:hypothetical protein